MCHIAHSDMGMYDWGPINEIIMIGNGQSIKATKIGKIKIKIYKKGEISNCNIGKYKIRAKFSTV